MDDQIELSIRIDLRQPRLGGSGISLQEDARLTVKSFLEAAEVLGQFHALIEKLRATEK